MWAKRRGWELSSRVDGEGQAESSLQCPCPSWERRLLCALSERLVLSGDGWVCNGEGASGVPPCASSKVMWEPSTKTTATEKPSFCFPGASLQNTFNYSQGEGLAWHRPMGDPTRTDGENPPSSALERRSAF